MRQLDFKRLSLLCLEEHNYKDIFELQGNTSNYKEIQAITRNYKEFIELQENIYIIKLK